MKIKGNLQHTIRMAVLFSGIILFLHVVTGIGTFGDLHAGAKNTKTQTEIKNISPKQAKELIGKEKDVFVLDVRTREEYNEVHIKDANLVPIQDLDQNISKIPKDKKLIVYCTSGKRSTKACEILKDKGLKELYNVVGGISRWQTEDYPVEKP